MNTDARLSVGLPTHPKTKKLIRRLGDAGAWGLVRLILWAAQTKPDGKFAGTSDEDLEIAIDWTGEPNAFINALVEVRFLDGKENSRCFHDWQDHNPYSAGSVHRKAQARFAGLVSRYGREKAERMFHAGQAVSPAKEDCQSTVSPTDSQTKKDSQATASQQVAGNSLTPSPVPLPKEESKDPAPRGAQTVWDLWENLAGKEKRGVLGRLIREYGEDRALLAVSKLSLLREKVEPVAYITKMLAEQPKAERRVVV